MAALAGFIQVVVQSFARASRTRSFALAATNALLPTSTEQPGVLHPAILVFGAIAPPSGGSPIHASMSALFRGRYRPRISFERLVFVACRRVETSLGVGRWRDLSINSLHGSDRFRRFFRRRRPGRVEGAWAMAAPARRSCTKSHVRISLPGQILTSSNHAAIGRGGACARRTY